MEPEDIMKKRMLGFIAAAMALVLLFSAGCETTTIQALPATQFDTDNELTVEQMRQDLDYLEQWLDYNHIDAWHRISRDDFHAEIEALEEKLDGMTRTQFEYEIVRLAALIGDAHTSAALESIYKGYRREISYEVKSFDDGWYIVRTDIDHKECLGWRIDKINGFNREQITEKLKPYISTETESWMQYKLSSSINNWDILYLCGVVNTETVTLTLSKDGKTKKVQYTAKPHLDIYNLTYVTLSTMDGYTEIETGINNEYYRYIEYDDLLFVQYNVCKNSTTYNMTNFVSKLEVKQAEKNYRNLVIDLRYNTGGSSNVIDPLCEFADDFVKSGGNLYVLIGEMTFSSGVWAVISLSAYNPVFIGKPTGGGINHYGSVDATVRLDNSGVYIGCSTKWFQILADSEIASGMPDIVAEHTFGDYFNGVDPELAVVRKLISGETETPSPQTFELFSGKRAESWAESFDFEKYPWANSMDGGFFGYLGTKCVSKWIDSRYKSDDYPGMMPAVFAQDFDLTPEELVAVMRFDTHRRASYGGTTDYYTEEDIKAALIFAFGSDEFDEAKVPDLEFNLSYVEFWSVYGTDPVENMEALGATVENAIPWSFITETGIRSYLAWVSGLSDKNEYTLQNFLEYTELSIVAYDDIFNTLKKGTSLTLYGDEKIAEIRTEVYGY